MHVIYCDSLLYKVYLVAYRMYSFLLKLCLMLPCTIERTSTIEIIIISIVGVISIVVATCNHNEIRTTIEIMLFVSKGLYFNRGFT